MSLPSKYAPQGLNDKDKDKTITSGNNKNIRNVEYTLRTIENRIQSANHNSKEDIEMIPTEDIQEVELISNYVNARRNSNTLPDIDVDMGGYDHFTTPETASPENSPPFNGGEGLLVVDTNFILSHLNILEDLKNISFTYRLQLAVPLTVMSELDGLKKSTRPSTDTDLSGVSVGHLARWANDWIYNSLAQRHSGVKGQKLTEKLDKNTSKDDAILDYCLYLQKYKNNSLIVLMSNDKNLCLKALSNNILTISYRKGMTADLIAKVVFNEIMIKFPGTTQICQPYESSNTNFDTSLEEHPTPDGKIAQQLKNPPEYVHKENPLPLVKAASTIFNEVEQIVIHAVRKAITESYGDDIILLQNYKPESIRDLNTVTSIIERFWISVFSEYFHHTPIRKDSLKMYTFTPSSNISDLKLFLDNWNTALDAIYSATMNENDIQALHILQKRWQMIVDEAY